MIQPPHPGETVKEDYLVPLGISVQLEYDLRIAQQKVGKLIAQKVKARDQAA